MKYMHPHVHCNIFYNTQDVGTTKCLSVDECIKICWYTHIMECYSAMKKNEYNILKLPQEDNYPYF